MISSSLLLLLTSLPAAGQQGLWTPNGVALFPNGPISGVQEVEHDGEGGAFFGTYPQESSPLNIIRLTSSGIPSTNWPAGGFVMPGRWGSLIVRDGAGGIFIVFAIRYNDYDIGVMHLSSNGVPISGWGDSTGVLRILRSDIWYDDYPAAIADGEGGLFVGSESGTPAGFAIRLQRLTASGAPAVGWPDTGMVVCSMPSASRGGVSLSRDASGGVYISWNDLRNVTFGVYAQRVSAQGAIVWAAYPLGRPVAVQAPHQGSLGSAVDDVGGVYISIYDVDVNYGPEKDIYLQHLRPDGEFAPGFSLTPKPVAVYPGGATSLEIIADGAGGAYMGWDDSRGGGPDYYLQRVSPSGDPMPGWPVGGLAVGSEPGHWEERGHMATDMQGGVYCAYNSEGGDGSRVMVQHLRGDATLAPGWPVGGEEVSPGLDYVTAGDIDAAVDSDGRGGIVLAWTRQYPNDFTKNGVYAQRFGPSTVVATTLALVSADAEPGRVRLEWQVGGDALTSAVVERRGGERDEWQALATLEPDGERRLRHEDRDVIAGGRYAYRLSYTFAGDTRRSAESWVDVPVAHVFALHGASPNPSPRGALAVAFSLRGTAPAALELYDVSGRRVLARDLRGTAPGRRTLALPEAATLGAGLYWVRLREGADEARARVVLIQ